MKRRLFTILSALSLLVSLALAVLWLRSLWVEDHVAPRPQYLIVSRAGELTVCHLRNVQLEVPVQRLAPVRRQLHTHLQQDLWPTADSRWRFAGIAYARSDLGTGHRYVLITVPYWILVAFAAVLPTLRVLRVRRSRAVRLAGLCPRCNYDLRATPDRCPECGTVRPGTLI